MKRLRELREKRGGLVKRSREILEKAEKENRNLTAEEKKNYDEAFSEIEELREQIEREERQVEIERQIAAGTQAPAEPADEGREKPKTDAERREAAFRKFIVGGRAALSAEESRAIQADSDVDGGYLVTPEQFVNGLIQAIDDMVAIRGLATKYTVTNAANLGVPALDADMNDADWTSELATGSEDTALKVGKRSLTPHPLAKRVKASQKLLRLTGQPEALIRQRLAYKFGVTEEKAFMTGTGAQQPLGVFTASANGISTGRDVNTGNTTTEIRFDGLIEAKYKLKAAYWSKARWIFHRDAVKQISKLKDGEGRYIWQPSVQAGQPEMVLNVPLIMSEFAPNTFTTGKYVGIIGDFSNYWIVDALNMQLQRLVELYAETNQIGFIGRMEVDGMPVLEEAFARVKLA